MKHASKWCPSASLVMSARSEALQEKAPEPCPRRALGASSYAGKGGAPSEGAGLEVVVLVTPLS